MTDFLSAINDYTLLKTIPEKLIEDALDRNMLMVSSYEKGRIIHFDGDICLCLDLVMEGKVSVERIDESGNLLTIADFYPDDVLGGNLVFSKNPRYPMTITAKSDTIILTIKKDFLFEQCHSNNDFLILFLQLISDHAMILGDKIKHYVNRSIRESVTAYLKNEYKMQKSDKIILNTTKKALADRMGVQRTSLSRELQKMKKEGLIDYDSSSITILSTYARGEK